MDLPLQMKSGFPDQIRWGVPSVSMSKEETICFNNKEHKKAELNNAPLHCVLLLSALLFQLSSYTTSKPGQKKNAENNCSQ